VIREDGSTLDRAARDEVDACLANAMNDSAHYYLGKMRSIVAKNLYFSG
jgi:hypothetical protein